MFHAEIQGTGSRRKVIGAQLSQRSRAMLRVVENLAVTQSN